MTQLLSRLDEGDHGFRQPLRTERWTIIKDGAKHTASIDVEQIDGIPNAVIVSYELLAQMLTDLGFAKEETAR